MRRLFTLALLFVLFSSIAEAQRVRVNGVTVGGGGANQDLNTTDSPTFASVGITESTGITFGVVNDEGGTFLMTAPDLCCEGAQQGMGIAIRTGSAEGASGNAGTIAIEGGQGFGGVTGAPVSIRAGLGHAGTGSLPGLLSIGGSGTRVEAGSEAVFLESLVFGKIYTAAPTSTDCDDAAETGRFAYDSTADNAYICSGASGWRKIVTTTP